MAPVVPAELETLPSRPEVERSLLGALLIDGGLLTRVMEHVVPEDFASEPHRLVYEACLALSDRKEAVDLVMVESELDEVAPALIRGEGDLALLDVADAMLALESWPGSIKVIGPVSPQQEMAVAFRREAPRLREAFDAFLAEARRDGSYRKLVQAYFPGAIAHFPSFFDEPR